MEDYVQLEELGRGSYGVVYKCQHKATGTIVAIKQLNDADGNEQLRKTALREAKILKQLQHPNVVRLLEVFRSKTKLYMVFEFMDKSVLKLLGRGTRGLNVPEVKKIMWQLVLALNFLHFQKIIHRDLKPENILVDDTGQVKLADFGFARPQAPSASGTLSPYVATRWYRAPELLVGDSYGPGVDVWALGCLLVELTTGLPLFPGKSNADQLWLILRCVGATDRQISRIRTQTSTAGLAMPKEEDLIPLEKRFAQLDRTAMSLLKACLRPDPKDRPTCEQLLSHEYFVTAASILQPFTDAHKAATACMNQANVVLDADLTPARTTPCSRPAGAAPSNDKRQQMPLAPRTGDQTAGPRPSSPSSGDLGARLATGSDGSNTLDTVEPEEQNTEGLSQAGRERILKWLEGIPEGVKDSTERKSVDPHAHQPAASLDRGVQGSSKGVNMPQAQPPQQVLKLTATGMQPCNITFQPPSKTNTALQSARTVQTGLPPAMTLSARNALAQGGGALSSDPGAFQSLLPGTSTRGRAPNQAQGNASRTSAPSMSLQGPASFPRPAQGDTSFEKLVMLSMGSPGDGGPADVARHSGRLQLGHQSRTSVSRVTNSKANQEFLELAKSLGVTNASADGQPKLQVRAGGGLLDSFTPQAAASSARRSSLLVDLPAGPAGSGPTSAAQLGTDRMSTGQAVDFERILARLQR